MGLVLEDVRREFEEAFVEGGREVGDDGEDIGGNFWSVEGMGGRGLIEADCCLLGR